MRTFVFENQAGTTRVEFVTNALTNAGQFTVMQIKGLSDAEERTGVNFRELTYTVEHFKQFATDNYLRLTVFTPTASTVLVEFDDISISTSNSWYEDNGEEFMKINLFQSYFLDSDKERQEELDYCLLKNLENPLISRIYLFTSVTPRYFPHDKIRILTFSARPTYRDFFNTIYTFAHQEENINIIANLDIYFNETLQQLEHLSEVDVYCLTRWDYQQDKTIKLLQRNDSQDSWIFKGSINDREMHCDFCMGVPGCDNRIAHEFDEAGYRVSNPSKSIQSIHLHLTQKRNYVVGKDVVPGPYKCLRPDML